MAGAGGSVTVTGLDAAVRMVSSVADRLRQIENGSAAILRVIASDVQSLISDSFRESVSPMGDAWKPLREVTLARRRKGPRADAPSARILYDSGDLQASIVSQPKPRGIRFGSNVVYAATHQFGRPDNRFFGRAPAPIPARPFLPIEGGQFGRRGPAGRLLEDIRRDVSRWITNGR